MQHRRIACDKSVQPTNGERSLVLLSNAIRFFPQPDEARKSEAGSSKYSLLQPDKENKERAHNRQCRAEAVVTAEVHTGIGKSVNCVQSLTRSRDFFPPPQGGRFFFLPTKFDKCH